MGKRALGSEMEMDRALDTHLEMSKGALGRSVHIIQEDEKVHVCLRACSSCA